MRGDSAICKSVWLRPSPIFSRTCCCTSSSRTSSALSAIAAPAALFDQAKQEMLKPHITVSSSTRLPLGKVKGPLGMIRKRRRQKRKALQLRPPSDKIQMPLMP